MGASTALDIDDDAAGGAIAAMAALAVAPFESPAKVLQRLLPHAPALHTGDS